MSWAHTSQFLLLDVSERRGCSGLKPNTWTFKNRLSVGAGAVMRTLYLPAPVAEDCAIRPVIIIIFISQLQCTK